MMIWQTALRRGTMMFAQPSSTPLCQRLNVIMTRWHGLIQIQGRTENGPL